MSLVYQRKILRRRRRQKWAEINEGYEEWTQRFTRKFNKAIARRLAGFWKSPIVKAVKMKEE